MGRGPPLVVVLALAACAHHHANLPWVGAAAREAAGSAPPGGPAAPRVACQTDARGGSVCGYYCRTGRDGRVACAADPSGVCALDAEGHAFCERAAAPAAPASEASADADAPRCRTDSGGGTACGYHCRLGADGRGACANTPNGVCATGTDGRVVCTRLAPGSAVGADRPTCRIDGDGRAVCGFHCVHDAASHVACSDRVDGVCVVGPDGRAACY